MRDKVIFDTNVVRNPEVNNFLGGRELLERFTQDADIVIPDTVIQEIKRQKRSSLVSNKTKFLTNPFHKLIGFDEANTKSFDVEVYIQKLLDDETIPFETIDLKNHNILPLIKEFAILKKAPFEAGDNTDKGFKDALIYFTILEYLQEIPNKYVYVFAKDARFKEALANHHNIIIIDSYEDFKKHGITQFTNDYFIEKINTELGLVITKDNVMSFWYNIYHNHNILIKIDEVEYIVEVDSGEIINYCTRDNFTTAIEELINSNRFLLTHRAIAKLRPYINYLSNEEIIKILEASFTNEDIWRIITDQDVKEFIGDLYDSKKELLTNPDVLNFLKQNFELKVEYS